MNRKVYCKLYGTKYSKGDLNISNTLYFLIILYFKKNIAPAYIFQDEECTKICLRKAKKFLCREVKDFVKNNTYFEENFKNNFDLKPKQISKLLNHRCRKISIYTALLVYFLVHFILKHNGLQELLNWNNMQHLNLKTKSGGYYMQKTYTHLVNVIEMQNVNPENYMHSEANYIIDSFNIIDSVIHTISDWYFQKYSDESVSFIAPQF